MDFKNLTDKEIISCHLHLLQEHDENRTVFSSLTAALRDARQNTGRDLDTGKDFSDQENKKLANWSGAMCYLIILDQVGKCYKPKGRTDYLKSNSITRSLNYYTNLNETKVNAIYALRNAFAHDYSISNYETQNLKLRHHFTLLSDRLKELIKLPKKQWQGYPDPKTVENMTFISLPSLGDLVEDIYAYILELHYREELEIVFKGGAKEIQTRYLQFMYTDKNNG